MSKVLPKSGSGLVRVQGLPTAGSMPVTPLNSGAVMNIPKEVYVIGVALATIAGLSVARDISKAHADAVLNSSSVVKPTPRSKPSPTERPRQARSYKASDLDFSFAENAVRYRDQVTATVNAILKTNMACVDVDPYTLLSKDERRSANPAMQIACKDRSGASFAVQFHAKDAANGKTFPAVDPIGEDEAEKWCLRLLAAKLPVDSGAILGDAYFRSSPGGDASIVGEATGGKQSYRVVCRFKGQVPTLISLNRKVD